MIEPRRPLRILLGSLKHVTAGKHSAFMPIAIGFIAALTRRRLGVDNVEFVLEEIADSFLDQVENWKPDIIGVSNYCWNAELNYVVLKHAKKVLPDVVCVAGGPEFDDDEAECFEFLKSHTEIDFFAHGEGEVPFATLVEKILNGETLDRLKNEVQVGMMSIHPDTGQLLVGERPIRDKDMDFIPSPYLEGLMDHFFDGDHAPMVQLARGCPYACTFCNAAQSWYNRVAAFSVERVEAELRYIAEKTKDHPKLPLAITDSNFGMFKRDIDIAYLVRDLQDTYGWPVAFDFTTGKSHYDRILHVNEIMRNTAHILTALQSTNEATLDVIKRKNLSGEKFRELHREIKRRGMMSATDLIVPLPEETKDSFLTGLEMITDEGVDLIVSNTLCLLKGTELNNRQTRENYGMKTMWRLVARQYGEYAGEKAFEVEEICNETNTMPYEDYLECRGIGAVAIIFSDPQFDVIHRHAVELGLSKFEVIRRIWQQLSNGQSVISPLYEDFLHQSASELFDSPEEVYAFYSKPENYERLKTGEIGDNLIRRFRGKVFIDFARAALELAYDCLKDVAREHVDENALKALDAAEMWTTNLRDVSPVFAEHNNLADPKVVTLDFDVPSWYENGPEGPPLTSFQREVTYRVAPDQEKIKNILDPGYRMYGTDKSLSIPRILEYFEISNFWMNYAPSEGHGSAAIISS